MKRFFYMAAVACLALFASCQKQSVEHTGDDTGKLYGSWTLDTKNVVSESIVNGKTTSENEDTDFTNADFLLLLEEPRVAKAQEGAVTFEGHFAYNAQLKQITFNTKLQLATGFPPRIMTLDGTFDVMELTDGKLVLRQIKEAWVSDLIGSKTTTIYAFHRSAEQQQQ